MRKKVPPNTHRWHRCVPGSIPFHSYRSEKKAIFSRNATMNNISCRLLGWKKRDMGCGFPGADVRARWRQQNDRQPWVSLIGVFFILLPCAGAVVVSCGKGVEVIKINKHLIWFASVWNGSVAAAVVWKSGESSGMKGASELLAFEELMFISAASFTI